MQKSRPLATGLALLFLVLLLLALLARFWASEKAYAYTGPIHIAADGEQVLLFASGDMYRLNHSGQLLEVLGSEVTGLHDDPIDLRMLPAGQLLIGEQRPASVRQCDLESWVCRPLGTAARAVIERQFKVLAGSPPNALILSDARGDTLWGIPEVGGDARKLVEDRTLAGPNGMVHGDDGNLWVADTDHRRILELIPADDGSFQPGREHSAMNPLTVGERFYPTMLEVSADGRIWVTQAAEYSQSHSDLLVYDPEDGPEALVGLPEGSYATDIVVSGDQLMVTDMDRYKVYTVDSQTLAVSEFGDPEFRQRMEQIKQQRSRYERLGHVAVAGVVFFALLMILVFSGALIALVVPLIRFATQAIKHKLGADGRRLYIRLANGRELAVEPSQLAFTGRLLLYRQYTFPLQGGRQQPVYAPGELQTWLTPLLVQAKQLTEMQVLKHMVKNQLGGLF